MAKVNPLRATVQSAGIGVCRDDGDPGDPVAYDYQRAGRDLLQLCGLRQRPESRELAERFGVLL